MCGHLIGHLGLIDELVGIDNSMTDSRTILVAEKGDLVSESDDLPKVDGAGEQVYVGEVRERDAGGE